MRSSHVLGYLAIALGLVTPSVSSAQYSKDNSAPPIEVPTTPVPQGPQPTAPPPAPKAPPKPAPAPPTTKTAPAAEPKKDEAKPAEGSEPTAPKYNNEGVFKISGTKGSGVVGGAKTKAPAATAGANTKTAKAGTASAKKTAANVAQWPGFRLTEDGGSEVMVEFSSNPASPTEHKAAGSVTYVFKGAHVIKHNNQNPLLTVHFNTPVMSAKLVPKKGELHLVVDMRPGANAAPTMGMRASSDGDGQQFFVKFPSGSWLPAGAENEEIGPAPTQKLKAKGSGETTEKKDAPPTTTTTPKTESGGKTGPAP
jgi:hypothetical protein